MFCHLSVTERDVSHDVTDVTSTLVLALKSVVTLPFHLASARTLGNDCFSLCLSSLQVSLARKIKTFATKMVITSGNDEDRGGQEKESKEESVLAMLGIVGTILNLIVIIFVYIYTTL